MNDFGIQNHEREIADEHAKRCAAELDHAGAVALLAEQTARAERAEAERDLLFDALNLHMRKTGITNEAMERVEAFRAVVDANEPLVRGECTRLAKGWNDAADARKAAEAERDTALAACAEMRAALERSNNAHQTALYDEDLDRDDERDAQRVIDDTHALLSRTDLGRGKVLVEREVVVAATLLITLLDVASLARWSPAAAQALADLDALLKKGGWVMRKIDHHHCSGVPCDICGPDPRDAEIALLKAEVERLTRDSTRFDADWSSLRGENDALRDACRAQIDAGAAGRVAALYQRAVAAESDLARLKAEVADLGEKLQSASRMSAQMDYAQYQKLLDENRRLRRALAAGPAALHYRSCDCCSIVERAQSEAMKEDK